MRDEKALPPPNVIVKIDEEKKDYSTMTQFSFYELVKFPRSFDVV